MDNNKCPICGQSYDDLGLCDPNCAAIIAADDQIRAEVAELNSQLDPDPELTKRLIHLGMKQVRFIFWKRSLHP